MVTISNGKTIRSVTIGAYKSIYKSKGFYILDKATKKGTHNKVVKEEASIEVVNEQPIEEISEPNVEEEVEEVVEKEWVTDLLEKPISQWSKEETANFAKEKGIDTSHARKLGEAKEIIKEWLEEQNK